MYTNTKKILVPDNLDSVDNLDNLDEYPDSSVFFWIQMLNVYTKLLKPWFSLICNTAVCFITQSCQQSCFINNEGVCSNINL